MLCAYGKSHPHTYRSTVPLLDADSNAHEDADADADRYCPYEHADSELDAHANPHVDSHPRPQPDSYANNDGGAQLHAGPDRDLDSDSNDHANDDPYADRGACADQALSD